jgi:hypothetical protein
MSRNVPRRQRQRSAGRKESGRGLPHSTTLPRMAWRHANSARLWSAALPCRFTFPVVAQTSSLLYRRLPVGKPFAASQTASEFRIYAALCLSITIAGRERPRSHGKALTQRCKSAKPYKNHENDILKTYLVRRRWPRRLRLRHACVPSRRTHQFRLHPHRGALLLRHRLSLLFEVGRREGPRPQRSPRHPVRSPR